MMKFVLYLSTIGLIFNCNLVAGQNGDAQKNKSVNPSYQSYLAHIAAANASQRLLDGNEANRWLNSTPVDYRGWEYYYLKQKIQGYTSSYNLKYAANDMDISNDGQTVAIAGADNHIHICNASDLTEIKQLKGHTDAVYGVDYFGKDAKLVSCARDFTIRVWDTKNEIQLWQKATKAEGISDVTGSPDGKSVAISAWYREEGMVVGYVAIYDAFSELKWENTFGEKPLVSIKFSHDGTLLAAAGWNWGVAVWDVNSKTKKYEFNFNDIPAYSAIDDLVFSADDAYLMAVSRNSTARVWNMYTGTLQFNLEGHKNAVYAGAFTNDGNLMITGSADGSIMLWSTETAKSVNTLFGHEGVVNEIITSADGKYFYSLGADNTIKKWDLTAASKYSNPAGQNGSVFGFDLSANDNFLVSQGDNGILTVWSTIDGTILKQFPTFGNSVNSASISPDGNYVVGCNWAGRIKVWETASGNKAIEFAGMNVGVVDNEFSPDGKHIAVAAYDSTITIWDFASGARLQQLKCSGLMYHVTYSSNGKYIVGASTNGDVTIFENGTFKKLFEIKTNNSSIYQCAFSPDNTTIAAVGEGREIIFINAQTGKIINKIAAHNERIYCVAWSPDGKRLATGSADNTVRIWDVKTNETTLVINDFNEDIYNLVFSSDSKKLYVNAPVGGFKEYVAE